MAKTLFDSAQEIRIHKCLRRRAHAHFRIFAVDVKHYHIKPCCFVTCNQSEFRTTLLFSFSPCSFFFVISISLSYVNIYRKHTYSRVSNSRGCTHLFFRGFSLTHALIGYLHDFQNSSLPRKIFAFGSILKTFLTKLWAFWAFYSFA